MVREILLNKSIESEDSYYNLDFKDISYDKRYFVSFLGYKDFFIFDYNSGEIVFRSEQPNSFLHNFRYPLAFSRSSEYFAFFTRKAKIMLLETNTWNLIWEKDLSE